MEEHLESHWYWKDEEISEEEFHKKEAEVTSDMTRLPYLNSWDDSDILMNIEELYAILKSAD